MSITKRVGENIRNHREMKNFSQGELARRLRVSRSYISTLENGARNPSIKSLEKIARVLEVNVASLVGESKFGEANSHVMPYVAGLIKLKGQEWNGKKWYHQRFDGAPYLIHMIAEAQILTRRNQKPGLNFNKHFCFFEDGKADWYMDTQEIEHITEHMTELGEKRPNFSKELMKEYEPFEKAFYSECEKIEKQNLYKLNNQNLIEIHDAFLESILKRNSSSSIIDGFALGSDRILEDSIRKAYESNPKISKRMSFQEVFSTLTTASHLSFVREAEIELFKLILAVRECGSNRRKLISEYRDRYFWITNNYVDAHVLSIPYFEDEMASIEASGVDVAAQIIALENSPSINAKKKEVLLKEMNLDKRTLFLLSVTEDFTAWQDERKKATLFTAHYCTLLLDEISRRVGISSNLLKYLSPREVSEIFTDTPPASALEARKTGAVFYWDESGHEARVGEEVKKIREELFGNRKLDDVQDFRGMTASLGKVQGHVRILKSVKEINSIKKGEILVAVMTRPDYVPAMKKAAAIITDEGGITSHAAIVSRELKIPCIIGTKIATHVLKDGDLVEVNANHGSVKIISRVAR